MAPRIDRAFVAVLDGVGCGQDDLTLSDEYLRDLGANSILSASKATALEVRCLREMGLGFVPGVEEVRLRFAYDLQKVCGVAGAMRPAHAGNGSPEGHQALMGFDMKEPQLFFHRSGIPQPLIDCVAREASQLLGREVAIARYPEGDAVSGTTFIDHPSVGLPIYESAHSSEGPLVLGVYTSSDSVLQIAFHADQMDKETSRRLAALVRENVLVGPYARVGRVIMRPFQGEPGAFKRIDKDRIDNALDPDGPTLISDLNDAGVPVRGLGKASEMFNEVGFSSGSSLKMSSDDDRFAHLLALTCDPSIFGHGLVLANFKNTDEISGHRRDPALYARHLERASMALGRVRDAMRPRDLLVVTADHGNDPGHKVDSVDGGSHTDHTREKVPVLVYPHGASRLVEIGIRGTFNDLAATLAEGLDLKNYSGDGMSFFDRVMDVTSR